DLETWQAEATAMLPGLHEDCLLLDQEVVDLPAGPALRRLVHHAGSEGRAVTLEQWTLLSGGHGTTLSFSVASADYDGLADTIAGLVAAFEPPTAASGPLP